MLVPARKVKRTGTMRRGVEYAMACVLVVREPGSQAAINGVCYRRSTGALATSGRNEFARIAFLPGTVQAADLHQEVVQSLALHPRSGNCPRSHCRGLLGDKIVRGAGVDCQSPATRFSLFGSPR